MIITGENGADSRCPLADEMPSRLTLDQDLALTRQRFGTTPREVMPETPPLTPLTMTAERWNVINETVIPFTYAYLADELIREIHAQAARADAEAAARVKERDDARHELELQTTRATEAVCARVKAEQERDEVLTDLEAAHQYLDGRTSGLGAGFKIAQRVQEEIEQSERQAKALRQELDKLKARRFPGLAGSPSVPWSIIAPWESTAQRNHSQSLERLAERGGLCATEMLHVLNGVRWGYGEAESQKIQKLTPAEANAAVTAIVKERDADAELLTLRQRVQALVRQWRQMTANANADGPIAGDEIGHPSRWTAVEMCADELDRMLATPPSGATEEDK